MKISKYLHSCLLVEENSQTILIDPGNYTYESNALKIETLNRLDYILITHEHLDHMYPPFIKELLAKFPKAKVITNQQASEELKKEGIRSETNENDLIKLEEVLHENVFGVEVAQNTKLTLFEKLTPPGDSFHFTATTPLLAMPIQAPWGSLTEAVVKIEALHPEVIFPIHDWHWRDEARKVFYKRLETYFKDQGIVFKGLETGEVFDF